MFTSFKTLMVLVKGQNFSWSVYLVLIFGTAISVLVLCWLLALKAGFENAVQTTGRADQVVLLRLGANNELESFIDYKQAATASHLLPVRRYDNGRYMASMEVMALAEIPNVEGENLSVMVRGVYEGTDSLRSEYRLSEGRNFSPGNREVILGKNLARMLGNISVGSSIILRGTSWKVVGLFTTNGDAYESEIWSDAATLVNALKINGVQSIRLRLKDGLSKTDIEDAIRANRQLRLSVFDEKEFFKRNAAQLSNALINIIIVIGSIMGLAAGLASANGMAFLSEKRHYIFGLLQAFGFKNFGVVLALLLEGTAVALVGAGSGIILAYFLVDDLSANVFNMQTFSQLTFEYQLRISDIVWAIIGSLISILLGAVLPIMRAIRTQPLKHLQANGFD